MVKKYQSSGTLFLWRFKKLSVAFGSFLGKHFFTSVMSIILLAIILSIGVGMYALFNSPRFQITDVKVSGDMYADAYEKELGKFLTKDFLGTNMITSLRYRMRFLPYYKNKYHWIDHIESKRNGNSLEIDIYGKQPALFYRIVDSYYAQIVDKNRSVHKIKKEGFNDLQFGSNLSGTIESGEQMTSIPVLELLISDSLLQYGFDPLFYSISADALIKQIQIIHNTLNDYSSMQYIPGGQKLILITKSKAYVYFDLRKNIYEQLRKYSLLGGTGVSLKGHIDVGTMDTMIFVR